MASGSNISNSMNESEEEMIKPMEKPLSAAAIIRKMDPKPNKKEKKIIEEE